MSDNPLPQQLYSCVIRHCAASICYSIGFHSVQKGSLDALTFLFDQFLSKTCRSSKALCEHTGRALVNVGDVFMALLNEGRPELANFDQFLDEVHHNRQPQFPLLPLSPIKDPPLLRISDPRPHPSHYPSFLPPFPDPHTYIRSEVRDEIDTNYERVRRLDAQNKRDWEMSLVRYALLQYPTVCVFRELDSRLMFEAKDVIEKQRQEFRLLSRQPKKKQHQKGQDSNNCPSMPIENGVVDEAKKGDKEPTPGAVEHGTAACNEMLTETGPEEIILPSTEDEEEVVLPDTNKVDREGAKDATADIAIARASTAKVVSQKQQQNNNEGSGAESPSTSGPTLEELLVEELSHPQETERSYVLKRIPHSCYILLPFDEHRPYLSALLTDDVDQTADDEQHNDDYFARILSKEMDEDADEEAAMDGEEGGAGGRNSNVAMEM